MTAYASKRSREVDGFYWLIEIHSVNRKVLDLHMHLGQELLFLDLPLRKIVTSQIQRGRVTVRVHLKSGNQGDLSLSLLKQQKRVWEGIVKELGYQKEVINFSFLLDQAEKAFSDRKLTAKMEKEIQETLRSALMDCIKMKESEGRNLAVDIERRLKKLVLFTKEVEKISTKAPDLYREKLITRLSQISEEVVSDERLLREVALLGEKIDITEEAVRLRSHVEQMGKELTSKEISIGRTLEFLVQEMLREINTMGSKSEDLTLTQKVVTAKGELEKIREQVQNIE